MRVKVLSIVSEIVRKLNRLILFGKKNDFFRVFRLAPLLHVNENTRHTVQI